MVPVITKVIFSSLQLVCLQHFSIWIGAYIWICVR